MKAQIQSPFFDVPATFAPSGPGYVILCRIPGKQDRRSERRENSKDRRLSRK
jgi:hypothetical protein